MNYNEKKHRFVPEDHRSFDDPPATSKQQTAAKCGTVRGSRIKRWEGCVAGRRKGRRRSGEDARGARYQFSLRGKTVAAPLIDRKILICLTRELLGREEGGGGTREKGDESEAMPNRSLTQRRQRWTASGT